MARVHQPLTGPNELGPLAPIVARAGTPDPADRISAADLARELEEALSELPAPMPLPLAGPLVTGELDGQGEVTELPGPPKPTLFDGEALEDPRRAGRARSRRGSRRSRRAAAVAAGPARSAARADPDGRHHHRGRWLLALLLVVAVLSGGAFALTRRLTPSHPVPVVRNDTEAQATAALAPLHLHLEVTSRPFDDSVPAGRIIRQTPDTGRLREGSAVAVDVSRGPAPVPVPDLTGLTQDQATQRLVGAGLTLGPVNPRIDATIKAGIVIDWTGRGGQLPKHSAVELVVSSGPPTVGIPDVHGKSFADATAGLAQAQLTGVEVDAFSDTVPKGQVVSTTPPAGTVVTVGAQVTVTVSKGQDLVAVPDVRTMTVAAATSRLEASGFSVSGVVGSPDRPVYVTNPAAGVLVKRGSAIKLYTS
jgi:eukaryotic-like serine/threonine-protein kinase